MNESEYYCVLTVDGVICVSARHYTLHRNNLLVEMTLSHLYRRVQTGLFEN